MRAYTSLSSSLSFSLLIISNINASHFLLLSNWLILSHVYIVVRSNSPKVKTCMNIRLWYLIGLFINSCISENILWNDFIKNYLAATCFGKQMVASAVRLKLNRLNVRTIHARERAGVGKNGKWECTHTHTHKSEDIFFAKYSQRIDLGSTETVAITNLTILITIRLKHYAFIYTGCSANLYQYFGGITKVN